MKRITVVVIAVLVISALLGGGRAGWHPVSQAAGGIEASGTIEAVEVDVAAEVGGRVLAVEADEGDTVQAGMVLVRLDDSLLQAALQEAEAAVRTAEADLKRVQAGPRAEEIAAAQAKVQQAEAERDGAKKAWENAQEALKHPHELDAQLAALRARVALAEQEVEQARLDLERAKWQRTIYEEGSLEYEMADKQVEAAEENLLAAQAAYEGAQRQLALLEKIRANPLALQVAVRNAEGQYKIAAAGVEVAKAALAVAQAGPTEEAIAVAEARLRQAQANLRMLQARQSQYVITAPRDGVITSKVVNVGETALPGMPLLTLADMDTVTLRLYIPETKIGLVQLGQPVEVRVDAYPGEVFTGEVVYISSEAEFTPKNIQTKEERVNLVFAVKVRIPTPAHRLKPGMPADAVIRTPLSF